MERRHEEMLSGSKAHQRGRLVPLKPQREPSTHAETGAARGLLSLQRSAGNHAVVHLIGAVAGRDTSGPKEKAVNPPPGPYTGRRLRNDKLDVFEANQHYFRPGIFKEFGPYPDEWAPLEGYLKRTWVTNAGSDAGIGLDPELRKAMWAILERFISAKVPDIKSLPSGRQRDGALKDAIWGESGKQYSFALRLAQAEFDRSNFRHFHEWAAVRFHLVQPPYAYHARQKPAQ